MSPPLIACLLLAGCATHPPRELTLVRGPAGAQPHAVVYRGVPIASGQIVLSEQGSPMSLFYSLRMRDALPYSHAGVLVVENGEPVIYDAVGQLAINLFGPPTDAIHGGIRRLPLDEAIDRESVVAIYDPPPGTHPGKMVTYAWKASLAGQDFDPYFDYRENVRLYCTEFVALAVGQAGGEAPQPIPIRHNDSLGTATDWLGLNAPGLLAAGSYAVPERHVATFSHAWSESEIHAHFAIKREFHRRFEANQKLGALFQWNGRKLDYRPDAAAFRAQVMAQARDGKLGASQSEVDARVRERADNFFMTPAERIASRPDTLPIAP